MQFPFDTETFDTQILLGLLVGIIGVFWYYLYVFHEVSMFGKLLVVTMIVIYLSGRILVMRQEDFSSRGVKQVYE